MTTPRRQGGPPRLEDRASVMIYLPRDLLEEVDRLRGPVPRSTWVRELLEREVERERRKGR